MVRTLYLPGILCLCLIGTMVPGKWNSMGGGAQMTFPEQKGLLLGPWAGSGLTLMITREKDTLQISDLRYEYVNSCRKCKIHVEKIPIRDSRFHLGNKQDSFFVQGVFLTGEKLTVRLHSLSPNCGLDQTVEAFPAFDKKGLARRSEKK